MSQKAQRREFDHMAGDISPEGHEERQWLSPEEAQAWQQRKDDFNMDCWLNGPPHLRTPPLKPNYDMNKPTQPVPLASRTAPKSQYPDSSRKSRRKAVLISEAINKKIDQLCALYFDDLAAYEKSLLNLRGDAQPAEAGLEWERVQRKSHKEHRLSVYNGQWRSWLRASPKSYDYLKSEGMFLKRVVALSKAMSSANETPDITSE